ncbi:MAG: MCE family protein [Desulfobacteraceae bacterium]|nr:MAG: MCE family protein [Desulfobacteraceae bacterium]
MATLKTKFSVGIFLIVGLAVIAAGIVWLGMSKYLERGRFFVAYFDESVQGLDRDSPVKYRGVYIGRVHTIGVAPDEKLIEVVMKIESDLDARTLNEAIAAQLKSVGITGLMFIELERRKANEHLVYPQGFNAPFPVVPTRPSEISKIFKGIEDVFDIFRALDTQTISHQLTQLLQKVNHTLDEAQLDAVIADVRTTLKNVQQLVQSEKADRLLRSFEQTAGSLNQMAVNADDGITEIRQTVDHLESIISTGGEDIRQISADLKDSAQEIKRAMESATLFIESTDRHVDSMQRQVQATLGRIEQAGETLNRLLERISTQPSQILFSTLPPDKPAAP